MSFTRLDVEPLRSSWYSSFIWFFLRQSWSDNSFKVC